MKTIILLLIIAFAFSADAKPFKRKPPVVEKIVQEAELPEPSATPTVVDNGNFTVAADGSVTRTKQKDAELRDWIVGIQNRAEKAEASETVAQTQIGQANTRADSFQGEVDKVTADRNAQAAAKDAAETQRDIERAEKEKEHLARVASDRHVSRIKTWLAVALGAVLVLLVQKLPFGLLMPPTSLYARVGASVAVFGLAWVIVARFC